MKILLFIPLLACAFFASSCRTATPIHPMTGEPSAECLPDNMHGRTVYATK